MMGKKNLTNKLFYSLSLEELVPGDHIVRALEKAVWCQLLFLSDDNYYSRSTPYGFTEGTGV